MDGDTYVLPYIDGDEKNCTVYSTHIEIDENGDLVGDRTDGYADNPEMCSCDNCGDSFDGDNEGIWVGRREDTHVCGSCEDSYTYVRGSNGNEYYVHEDDAVRCDDTYYDTNYLHDNDIVYSEHDGEYYEQSECVQLDRGEDWVHTSELDDRFACLAEDDNVWAYRNDCWQCAASGQWYSDNVRSDYYAEPVEGSDGKEYHEDCLPEPDAQAYTARTQLTYDAVFTAAFEGVPLHCHHVHQYIDHTY
jgi:hypothetical protein